MSLPDDLVLSFADGPVTTLVLNRPQVLNAFDEATVMRLRERLVAVARDPLVRAVVLTGAGRAFCAGGDLQAALRASPERPGDSFYSLAAVFHQCIVEIRTMGKPVIAALNGPAAGGGFSMALACDLRIMSDVAFLQQAYTSNGLTIDGGGSFMLPRLVGAARALEMAFLDERLGAERALALGLVHRVVPAARLAEEAQALAAQLARRPTEVLGRVKGLINQAFDRPLEAQLEDERRQIAAAADSPEGREGLAAFVEKRAPDFVGAERRR